MLQFLEDPRTGVLMVTSTRPFDKLDIWDYSRPPDVALEPLNNEYDTLEELIADLRTKEGRQKFIEGENLEPWLISNFTDKIQRIAREGLQVELRSEGVPRRYWMVDRTDQSALEMLIQLLDLVWGSLFLSASWVEAPTGTTQHGRWARIEVV